MLRRHVQRCPAVGWDGGAWIRSHRQQGPCHARMPVAGRHVQWRPPEVYHRTRLCARCQQRLHLKAEALSWHHRCMQLAVAVPDEQASYVPQGCGRQQGSDQASWWESKVAELDSRGVRH